MMDFRSVTLPPAPGDLPVLVVVAGAAWGAAWGAGLVEKHLAAVPGDTLSNVQSVLKIRWKYLVAAGFCNILQSGLSGFRWGLLGHSSSTDFGTVWG
uniref:Putative secreted protein n=1 Tax=Anopheles darlingi TaxID=43151 RepID=A0A2M4DD60_ANODA